MKAKMWVVVILLAGLPLVSGYAQAPGAGAADLSPGAVEVVKLAGAGTSEDVVMAYVQNAPAPFNLSAEDVLYLKDVGVSSPVITAMLNRDAALRSASPAPAPEPVPAPMVPAPAPVPAPEGAPAPAPVYVSTPPPVVTYFYNDLSPYGSWIDMPGFGWCWQPTVAVVSVGWQPYCQSGHWLNTEAGWFWASDYSWGWAPFHYGRWHHHPTAGWIWFPDKVWGPAWVVWRSGGAYCGWAPLPLHAEFDVRLGWRFNGLIVSANFDFGLPVACFTFVGMKNFCDHDLGHWRLPPTQVNVFYHNTTIINNYTYVNNTYVNHGIQVARIESVTGSKLTPIHFKEPPAGWKPGQPLSHGAGSGLVLYRPGPLSQPKLTGPITAVKFDPAHPHVTTSLTHTQPIKTGTGGTTFNTGGNKTGTGGTTFNTGGNKTGTGGTTYNPSVNKTGTSGITYNPSVNKSGTSGTTYNPSVNKTGTSGSTSSTGGNKPAESVNLNYNKMGSTYNPGGSKTSSSGSTFEPGREKTGTGGNTYNSSWNKTGTGSSTYNTSRDRLGSAGSTVNTGAGKPGSSGGTFNSGKPGSSGYTPSSGEGKPGAGGGRPGPGGSTLP